MIPDVFLFIHFVSTNSPGFYGMKQNTRLCFEHSKSPRHIAGNKVQKRAVKKTGRFCINRETNPTMGRYRHRTKPFKGKQSLVESAILFSIVEFPGFRQLHDDPLAMRIKCGSLLWRSMP
jgi:hypothetical protein